MTKKVRQIIFSIPTLNEKNLKWVECLRGRYSPGQVKTLLPHFTMLSTERQIQCNELENLLNEISMHHQKINFTIHRALAMPPLNGHDSWYAFLVPDQGFSDLSKLHASICCKRFNLSDEQLFPFIPHITVGLFSEKTACLNAIDEINAGYISLSGNVDEISAAQVSDDGVEIIKTIELSK